MALFMGLMIVPNMAFAQDDVYNADGSSTVGTTTLKTRIDARKQNLKAEQKALQAKLDSALYEESLAAIEDTAFTLEADRVIFKDGEIAYVTSNTNFVSVNKNHAVVQVAFNVPASGFNGLGGITVQGSVMGYQIKVDKKGEIHVEMDVQGTAISARVYISMFEGAHDASVDVVPNFNSDRITLNGVLLPLKKSQVYQGFTL